MKTLFSSLFFLFITIYTADAQLYRSQIAQLEMNTNSALGEMSFVNKEGASFIYNDKTNTLTATVQMAQFSCTESSMSEKFHKSYVESEKYPKASFNGRLNEKVDLNKDGTYFVTLTGTLVFHGVTKPKTISGKITVKNGKLLFEAKTPIKLADYQISVPSTEAAKVGDVLDLKIATELTQTQIR